MPLHVFESAVVFVAGIVVPSEQSLKKESICIDTRNNHTNKSAVTMQNKPEHLKIGSVSSMDFGISFSTEKIVSKAKIWNCVLTYKQNIQSIQ